MNQTVFLWHPDKPSLPLFPPDDQEDSRYEEMREAAEKFHRDHPKVWQLFVRFTKDRIKAGFKHYSVNAIFERIRWETDEADTEGGSQFKLNDHHRPFYARAFMTHVPEHGAFFRTRVQKSRCAPRTNLPALGPDDFPYTQPDAFRFPNPGTKGEDR